MEGQEHMGPGPGQYAYSYGNVWPEYEYQWPQHQAYQEQLPLTSHQPNNIRQVLKSST